ALAEEAASREAEQTSGLLTISGEMLTTLDSAAALQAVVEQARHALDADFAALLMLSPGRDSLDLVAAAGTGHGLEPQKQPPLADSVSGRAVTIAGPFTCLDTAVGGVKPVGCRTASGRPAA